MTYEELVKEVKKNYGALDASNIKEHVAVQFNIEGEAEGAFYVEIADSNVDVEPFEYYDRDAVVTTSADIALSLSSKKVSLKDAYNDETAKVWGDLDKEGCPTTNEIHGLVNYENYDARLTTSDIRVLSDNV